MKSILNFFLKLVKVSQGNELFTLANELTFKLLLAFFPFIIFLMSLVGFFNIDASYVLESLNSVLPDSIYSLVQIFVDEVIDIKNPSVLSISLFLAIYSASAGFESVIKGINKAYSYNETRGYIKRKIISILLVLFLAFAIIVSILTLLFGNKIYGIIEKNFDLSRYATFAYSFFIYLATLFILLIIIVIIYKFSSSKKVKLRNILPGAMSTLIVWILSSTIFNIYINNFSKFSKIYGSIASIVIMMYWLNIISIILLLGTEINVLLMERKE